MKVSLESSKLFAIYLRDCETSIIFGEVYFSQFK